MLWENNVSGQGFLLLFFFFFLHLFSFVFGCRYVNTSVIQSDIFKRFLMICAISLILSWWVEDRWWSQKFILPTPGDLHLCMYLNVFISSSTVIYISYGSILLQLFRRWFIFTFLGVDLKYFMYQEFCYSEVRIPKAFTFFFFFF